MTKKSNKSSKKKNVLKSIILGVIMVGLVLGFYYYLSNKPNGTKSDETVITKTQQVLAYNFEERYPPTPKEVLKLYSDITQCFYNEPHSEEEIEQLALKMQKLYDAELIANQTEEIYFQSIKNDIAAMEKAGYKISSFSVSPSTDVDYFSEDGFEWARLYCVYGVRKGTALNSSKEQFLLRKDSEGYWKIYGWKLVDENN